MGHAIDERVVLFGTRSADYIRASGHSGCIAMEASQSRRKQAEYMTAPERFAEKSDSLLHRGRRPYMTHSDTSRPSNAALRKIYSITSSMISGAPRLIEFAVLSVTQLGAAQ